MKKTIIKMLVLSLAVCMMLSVFACNNDPVVRPTDDPNITPSPTPEPEESEMEKREKELPEAEKKAVETAEATYKSLLEEISVTEEQAAEALVFEGNTKRVEDVIVKALMGEKVTVGLLGDSIPSGAGASESSKTLGNRIFNFFCNAFHPLDSASNAEFVNASIGSNSLSNITFRMDDDLLAHKPDLVVYTVWTMHDGTYDKIAYESTIKRILDTGAALIVEVVTADNGTNNTNLFKGIAEHYNIPLVSWAKAFKAAKFKWSQFGADSIHPNDRGHGGIAASAEIILINAIKKLADGNATSEDITMPEEPKGKDGWLYTGATVIDRNDEGKYTVESIGSFKDKDTQLSSFRTYHGWKGTAGGDPLVITVDVTNGCMLLFEHNTNVGKCKYKIENAETGEVLRESTDNNGATYLYSWNTAFCRTETPMKVRITITPTEGTSLLGIMVA